MNTVTIGVEGLLGVAMLKNQVEFNLKHMLYNTYGDINPPFWNYQKVYEYSLYRLNMEINKACNVERTEAVANTLPEEGYKIYLERACYTSHTKNNLADLISKLDSECWYKFCTWNRILYLVEAEVLLLPSTPVVSDMKVFLDLS